MVSVFKGPLGTLPAILGNQRKRPKHVWHFLVGVKQHIHLLRATHTAMTQRGEVHSSKEMPILSYGTNRAAFNSGDAVYKLGPPGGSIWWPFRGTIDYNPAVVQEYLGWGCDLQDYILLLCMVL